MDPIILTDTEAESSMEQDGEEKLHTRASNANSNATKSLFNITMENLLEEERQQSLEFKDYETRLQHEMKEWKSVIFNLYSDLKKSKLKHPTVDQSILSQEKREYLQKAPCLQSFIRESMEFCEQAHIFMEVDVAELMEALENLEGLCEHRMDMIKVQKIAENLANYQKNRQ